MKFTISGYIFVEILCWILPKSDEKCRKYEQNFTYIEIKHVFQCADFHKTHKCELCGELLHL